MPSAPLLQLLAQQAAAAPAAPRITMVGVGPGDPELLTLAALRAIAAAAVVAYPVARPEAEGMAARIAAPWIRPEQRRLPLLFPMVEEAEPRQIAWRAAADALAAEVAAGRPVVLLCEGDASLYASCSYALLALAERHPQCAVRVIPGITAVAAAAAAASGQGLVWPLALQQEPLLIRPTPDDPSELAALLEQAAAAGMVLALLKLGRRWPCGQGCVEGEAGRDPPMQIASGERGEQQQQAAPHPNRTTRLRPAAQPQGPDQQQPGEPELRSHPRLAAAVSSNARASAGVGARIRAWRSCGAPAKPVQVQPMCLRAISRP